MPIRAMLILLILALALPGCGRKPDSLSAPQGEELDQFPRQYPAY